MNLENKKTALEDDAAIYQRLEEKSSAKTEREKFRELPFKGKVRYFLDYYAFKVFIILAVAALIAYSLYITFRPKPTTAAYVVIVDTPWPYDMVNAYRDKLPKLLGKDPKEYEVSVVNNLESGNVNDGTAISTYIFADNLDIMIAPTDVIERYATGGVLADLSEWLPADILAAIPEEDRLLSEVKGLSEGQHYVAFRINNSLMSRTCIPPKEDENIKDEEYYALPYDMYLAIHPANKDRLPDVYDVIRQFLGLPIPERQE